MAYYDESGKITIDEVAAKADIRRIETAINRLEDSRKAISALISQAAEGQGQTAAAVTEKAAAINTKINDLIRRLNETKDFINNTVAHYHQVDEQLKSQILASGGGE